LNHVNQVVVHANDVNLLGKNISSIKDNAESILHTIEEIGLEMNVNKTRYINMT